MAIMIGSLTVLAILAISAEAARNYLSANSFSVDSTTSRASVRVAAGRGADRSSCSGTLISSNIVYTAAHCVHGVPMSSVTVFHNSNPTGYRAKRLFIPEHFGEAYDFVMRYSPGKRNCGTKDCKNGCVQENLWMDFYYMTFDYALILLDTHMPVCDNSIGPVAASLQYSSTTVHGKPYVPADEKYECFVAGYGVTEDPSLHSINMAIVDRTIGIDNVNHCGTAYTKGFDTIFHNSSHTNGHRTINCLGDSGVGFQCISKGGTVVHVIGIHTKNMEVYVNSGPQPTAHQRCAAQLSSVALATNDHFDELFNKMEEWNELENYMDIHRSKCYHFLQKHPYHSVMQTYLGRNPEF